MSNKKYTKKDKLEKMLDNPKIISWRLALNTVEALYAQLEDRLTATGCNMSRFEMLFHIYFSGPLSAIQLSTKMGVSRGNISAFVRRLLKDDLITPCKFSSTQTRPKYTLSMKGEVYFEKVFKTHLAHINELISPLSLSTRRELALWTKGIINQPKDKIIVKC